MKDIVITRKALRRELFILLGCFIFAILLNIYAIIKYSRPAIELVSMIGYVIVVTVIAYLILVVIRLIILFFVWLINKIFRKK
jgi:uncharacterized membrane protein YdbT with pleckstrin-like domain